jgi:hypothetical protein
MNAQQRKALERVQSILAEHFTHSLVIVQPAQSRPKLEHRYLGSIYAARAFADRTAEILQEIIQPPDEDDDEDGEGNIEPHGTSPDIKGGSA